MRHLPSSAIGARRSHRRCAWLATGLSALALSSGAAMAGPYYRWEAVALPASSLAACGDGSPYRFFVNRTPLTSKTVVVFEGGGACWDQAACKGAHNGGGVAARYMSDFGGGAFGLVTPFATRLHPLQKVRTQSWNIVYVPYCTGDVHGGDKVAVYADETPGMPLVFHHRGARNVEALARWLADNMARPDHLFVTGFSAGASGATTAYATLRDTVQPRRASLLADSGPLMQARRGTPLARAPSLPMHEAVRAAWGLDEPGGPLDRLSARLGGRLDRDNLGSVTTALAQAYPQDRLGFAAFQSDAIYSDYLYRTFHPEIASLPKAEDRLPLLLAKWQVDIGHWIDAMAPHANVGYYVPYRRQFIPSHCLTTLTFFGTGIPGTGHRSVGAFVDNLIGSEEPLMRAYQTDAAQEPAPGNTLLALILGLFGL